MVVCFLRLYVVMSYEGRGLCDELITLPEEFYRVCNCVLLGNLNTEEDKAQRRMPLSNFGPRGITFTTKCVYCLDFSVILDG
jgi:hypothetical protein